jgi:hypothetical protein
MATIENRVLTALEGSTSLMALVTGISQAYPETFEKLPVMSYYKIMDKTEHQFGGGSYAEKTINIDIWSKSSALNNQIADEVTAALSFMLKDIETDVPDPNYKHKNIKYFIHE